MSHTRELIEDGIYELFVDGKSVGFMVIAPDGCSEFCSSLIEAQSFLYEHSPRPSPSY